MAQNAGFYDGSIRSLENLLTIVGISYQESAGSSGGHICADAVHTNADGSVDRGALQINSAAHPYITPEQAFDPQTAFNLAYQDSTLSNKGTTFKPWAAFNDGSYKNGLNEVGRAAGGIPAGASGLGILDPGNIAQGISESGPAKAFTSALDPLASLAKTAGDFKDSITSGSLWARIGVGTVGLLFVAGALLLLIVPVASMAAQESGDAGPQEVQPDTRRAALGYQDVKEPSA